MDRPLDGSSALHCPSVARWRPPRPPHLPSERDYRWHFTSPSPLSPRGPRRRRRRPTVKSKGDQRRIMPAGCSSTMRGWTHFGHITPKSVHNMSKICPNPLMCPKCAQNLSNPVEYVQKDENCYSERWGPWRQVRSVTVLCLKLPEQPFFENLSKATVTLWFHFKRYKGQIRTQRPKKDNCECEFAHGRLEKSP